MFGLFTGGEHLAQSFTGHVTSFYLKLMTSFVWNLMIHQDTFYFMVKAKYTGRVRKKWTNCKRRKNALFQILQ